MIADRGIALLQAVADLDAELAGVPKGLAALIHFYVDRGRRADTLHRHLERTVHDACGEAEDLDPLVDLARRRHRAFADAVQKRLMSAVREEGWPVAGFTRHTQVFDRHVAPALARQRKVALFMVDALRYELAAEVVGRLPDGMTATLEPALGQMPGITAVGMAALLPAADGKLRLTAENGELVPSIGGKRLSHPTERFDYLRGIYGDRVAVVALDDLLKPARYRPRLAETVHLLLVKSTEIDTAGEHLAGAALGLMAGVLERLLRATKVLQGLGFAQAVLATDRGFVLLGVQPLGDKVEKPQGQWQLSKVRCVAGSGGEDQGTAPAALARSRNGIAGAFAHPTGAQVFRANKPSLFFSVSPGLCDANQVPILRGGQ